MTYDASVRVWYGPESYQHAGWLKPTAQVIGVCQPLLPCIVYRPGGGWAGADAADLESRGWWLYGLNDATNLTHRYTYAVFVLQTASVGYNRRKATGLTAWVTATAYADGDYRSRASRLWVAALTHTSGDVSAPSATWTSGSSYTVGTTVIRRTVTRRQYICTAPHVADALNEAGLGIDTAAYWTDVSPATAWADLTAYVVGNVRESGGSVYYCVANHTSAVGVDDPATGTDWEPRWRLLGTIDNHNCLAYWREVGYNETGQQQIANQGELTPGGLDEGITNVQQFVGWLRRNAATFGIDPTQVCVAGASAGGQLAGCAAYAEDLPWSRDSQVYGAARPNRYHSQRPNAALLSITPVDLTSPYHTEQGLLNGLWGETMDNTQWDAMPDAEKRAMSPLHVLKRTGLAVPTCLDYIGGAAAGHTAGSTFAGLTGTPYHHPDNGWLMLRALTGAPPDGLRQTGHIFFDNEPSPSIVWRSYTAFGGSPMAQGTSATPQVAASAVLAWLNIAMGV
jgi:hypothetical protein